MTRLFLHFWNTSATFRIWQKEPVSQICVVPFSNFGNLITFGPLRIRYFFSHLNYIAHCRPHLRCCYYFASHKQIYYFASYGLTK